MKNRILLAALALAFAAFHNLFAAELKPGMAAAAKMDAAPVPGGTTYYVDSKAGRNSNPGTSPEFPW